jgi:hypothetical protein
MTQLFFDIETTPVLNKRMTQFILDSIASKEGLDPDGSAEGNEKIQKAIQTKFEKAIESSSLNGTRGEIYCISWAFDGQEVKNSNRGSYDPETGQFELSEAQLIAQLDQLLFPTVKQSRQLQWVAHNIEFDMRFLWQRLALNNSPSKRLLPIEAKPWSDELFDTMKAWSGFRGYSTLQEIATALNIDIDDGIVGSEVWQCLTNGEHERVIKHCNSDIVLLRDVYRRVWG